MVANSQRLGVALDSREHPLVRRLLAPNPGPYTGPGTNTYLVGAGAHRAIIDPGPDDAAHIDRILATAESEHAFIDLILVTHSHADHLGGARMLAERTGALLAAHERIRGVNRTLSHGQRIPLADCELEALFTPGHAGDHYCFLMRDQQTLFSGDLIAGFGTVVVAPPDGDMDEYLASLRGLRDYELGIILPGHWSRIDDPAAKITEYVEHRLDREREIILAMRAGDTTTAAMVARIYPGLDPRLVGAARSSVTAHLISLERRGVIRATESGVSRGYQVVSTER